MLLAGKTSFVKALASELQLCIYVVTLSSRSITDDSLRELLSLVRKRGILLFEDIDAAFPDRSRRCNKDAAADAATPLAIGDGAAPSDSGTLSFSGLLNALDGVAAQEGNMVFMTTNHITRLDAALTRPGRVDMRCEFALCDAAQARALFLRFYTELCSPDVEADD